MPRRVGAVVVLGVALACSTATALSAPRSTYRCPVTLAHGRVPPEVVRLGGARFEYGNSDLRVHLWPHGVLVAGRLPDGGYMAEIGRDGSISTKLAWWRGESRTLVGRKLVVSGRRLDAPARPLRAYVPEGYGSLGVQPTGPIFPTVGCWRVVGTQGRASLSFVVKVVKIKR